MARQQTSRIGTAKTKQQRSAPASARARSQEQAPPKAARKAALTNASKKVAKTTASSRSAAGQRAVAEQARGAKGRQTARTKATAKTNSKASARNTATAKTPAAARSSAKAPPLSIAKKSNGKGARTSAGPASPKRISEGSRAPDFRAADQAGRQVSSEDLKGKPYVLYFYPKDDTPGCTREACSFRDLLPQFLSKQVEVLGVSPDSVASHGRFKQKYGLTFKLLADEDKELAHAYGVWVKKQNYGREYMGVERSTFLVDKNGVVRKAWRGVRVDGHVEDVLGALATLD